MYIDRRRTIIYIVALVIMSIVGINLVSGRCDEAYKAALEWFETQCVKVRNTNYHSKTILVVHSQDAAMAAYKDFDQTLLRELEKNGFNAEGVKNVYLHEDRVDYTEEEKTEVLREDLRMYDADLIVVEGDKALYRLLHLNEDELEEKPIVACGVRFPNWKKVRMVKTICGFEEDVDVKTNLDLAVELSGKSVVVIELDRHEKEDSLLVQQIRAAIDRPPFVDDLSLHIPPEFFTNDANFDKEHPEGRDPKYAHLADSIVVLTLSARQPIDNVLQDSLMTPMDGYQVLYSAMKNSHLYAHLSVKSDEYTNMLLDKSDLPQFTMCGNDFGGGNGRYLAGYFASAETKANDVARFVVAILKGGQTPEQLSFVRHEKKMYMDYKAMQRMGMQVEDYDVNKIGGSLVTNKFHIVNAPKSLTQPLLFYGNYVLYLLAVVFIASHISTSYRRWILREREQLLRELANEKFVTDLALKGLDSYMVEYRNGLFFPEKALYQRCKFPEDLSGNDLFATIVHKSSQEELNRLKRELLMPGFYSRNLYMTTNGGESYEWWQLRFMKEEALMDSVNMMLVNINDEVKHEQELIHAKELAEEAMKKGDFLMNIDHEIRTPLNAILGFTQLLTVMEVTPEEREMYGREIANSSKKLSTMMEDILLISRIETDNLIYSVSRHCVDDLVGSIYNEWRNENFSLYREVEYISDVHFFFIPGRHDLYIDYDPKQLTTAINKLLLNAFKFSGCGDVAIGWVYRLGTNEVEIFVEDGGIGIDPECQSEVFNLFYKENYFVPGAGIGLTIAKQVVERLGGRIELQSRQKMGTRVSIYFKAVDSMLPTNDTFKGEHMKDAMTDNHAVKPEDRHTA